MTVHERIRFIEGGILEDRITVTDPKYYTRPFTFDRVFDTKVDSACAELSTST